MSRRRKLLIVVASVFLALALFGGLLWANAVVSRHKIGRDDFVIPWVSARIFLKYGTNPYEQTLEEMSRVVIFPQSVPEALRPLKLGLPLFIEFFFIPFSLVQDYLVARALWLALLEAALIGLAWLNLHLASWRPPRLFFIASILFTLLWFHALLPLVSGNIVILVMLCLIAGLVALRAEAYEWAGALFAFTVFMPRVSGIFLIFLLWWLIYHRRWRLLWGALMVLVLLLVISLMVLPGWLLPYLRALYANLKVVSTLTPRQLLSAQLPFLGSELALVLTLGLIVVLFLEWRAVRGQGFRHFLWTASLTLTITPLLGIPTEPVGYVVLTFPLIYILALAAERWPIAGRPIPATILLLIVFSLMWILMGWLTTQGTPDQIRNGVFFAGPVFLVIGLYWVRWWTIRPPRTWLETIEPK